MGKIIQKIKAWAYPCEKEFMYFDNTGLLCIVFQKTPANTKENLIKASGCQCMRPSGKDCLPRQIEIIVREVSHEKG